MGRGSAYSWDFFMNFDQCDICTEMEESDFYLNDHYWKDFVRDLIELMKVDPCDRPEGRESYIIGETDRFELGIDSSGGLSCVFVKPKEYDHHCYGKNGYNGGQPKEYRVWREVEAGFNRLCESYPTLFRFPTSAWTSGSYGNRYAERKGI